MYLFKSSFYSIYHETLNNDTLEKNYESKCVHRYI